MARYTPEFLASVRRRYEDTDEPLRSLAADFGVGVRTLQRMAAREGWRRRDDRPPRKLPEAMRLLDAATALLAASGDTAAIATIATATTATPTPDPSPQELAPGRAQARSGWGGERSPLERLERLVEAELAAAEAARRQHDPLARAAADAERTARTLATLTQTLHVLARLRGRLAAEPDSDDDDNDDLPRDIGEFRRDLARRIDAFVASRAEPRDADGDCGPAPLVAAR